MLKPKKLKLPSKTTVSLSLRNLSPDDLSITHTSLFDNTIAGIEVKNKPFFSVQYHPESSPGPQDSRYLFDKFFKLIRPKRKDIKKS